MPVRAAYLLIFDFCLREGSRALRPAVLAWLLLGLAVPAAAQDYVRQPPDLDRLTQELFAEITSDQVPYEDLYETLLQYYQTPLNLNTATREQLRALLLLSESQIGALLTHRAATGELVSVYELQAIEGFDLKTIYRVASFVTVSSADANARRGNLWRRIREDENNAFFLRYERVLQTRRGYTPADTVRGRATTRYVGSPDKIVLRYRVSHTRDFSLGFTAEKDAGERLTWAPGRRQFGADYVSAHFVVQERGRLKALALGDYQLQFGQGLLLSSGLAVGKGAETITTLRRSSVGIRHCWKTRFSGVRPPPINSRRAGRPRSLPRINTWMPMCSKARIRWRGLMNLRPGCC